MNKKTKKVTHEDAKQTILIVDDEALLVDSLSVFISDTVKNLRILTANNGQEALEILEKEKINLMLLDIQMPVMDGIQLLAELHRRDKWLPVIIISSIMVFPNNEGKTFEDFGIVAYIEKPVNLENLVAKIFEVLRPKAVYKRPDSEAKFEQPSMPESDYIPHIEAELTRLLGNSARSIINKKITDLGFNEYDFPETHAIDLVEKVCEEIDRKTKRILFKKKMIEYFKNRQEGGSFPGRTVF